MNEPGPIAQYPKLSPLKLAHKKTIEEFTGRFLPYSDFNFTSLYCWDIDGSIKVSWLNENLVIKMPDYLTGKPIYSILGEKSIDESIKTLLSDFKVLNLVPRVVVKKIEDRNSMSIKQDRAGFDYIYLISDLADMAGQKYKKKRNKIHKFEKILGGHDIEVMKLKKLNKQQVEELDALCDQWVRETSRSDGDFAAERIAINRLWASFNELDPLLVLVYIDGQLQAFTLNVTHGKRYASCLFEKAVKNHGENIYAYLAHHNAKVLQNLGLQYVSWMQDVGLEGLRASKLSYHPKKMLKKYTIRKV